MVAYNEQSILFKNIVHPQRKNYVICSDTLEVSLVLIKLCLILF